MEHSKRVVYRLQVQVTGAVILGTNMIPIYLLTQFIYHHHLYDQHYPSSSTSISQAIECGGGGGGDRMEAACYFSPSLLLSMGIINLSSIILSSSCGRVDALWPAMHWAMVGTGAWELETQKPRDVAGSDMLLARQT